MTKSAEQFIEGFVQAWREQQERLWTTITDAEDATSNAPLEQAWRDSCQQWWHNLHQVVPQPLQVPLAAALEQSQLCLSIALRGGQLGPADLTLMMQPLASMQTALLDSQPDEVISPAQRSHLLNTQALTAQIATISQLALAAGLGEVRRLTDSPPRELFTRCARIMESVYREHVARDDFVQLIGQWVNSHVTNLNNEREQTASAAQATASPYQQPPGQFTEPWPRTGSHAPASPPCDPAQALDLLRDLSEKMAAGAISLTKLPADSADFFSPHEVVFECDGIKLRHFSTAAIKATNELKQAPIQPPLLLVYSLVNRPYILDLNEDRSLVRAICATGRDVYLLDWGNPGPRDHELGLDDYINRYLHECVTFVLKHAATQAVDIAGICQGGTLALCYAAMEPARVRKLALLATPVDFHSEDFLLARWLRDVDVDALVNGLGNIPGHLLNWAFIALRPMSLSAIKAIELLDLLDRPKELATYIQMERWLQHSTDQAGKAFAEFAQTFVTENALVSKNVRLGDRVVHLGDITQPVLNMFATHDHIVPPSSSRPLAALLPNARYSAQQIDCGHIAVFAGHRMRTRVPRILDNWLSLPD